jgi:hypothetical protein
LIGFWGLDAQDTCVTAGAIEVAFTDGTEELGEELVGVLDSEDDAGVLGCG